MSEHQVMVMTLEELLTVNGYTLIFEEPFGEGKKVLYRNGQSDIFIEHIDHSGESIDEDLSTAEDLEQQNLQSEE